MSVVSPTATRCDITCRLGDTFTLTFPILDSASAPVTVTGWTVRAQVRHAAGDSLLYEWATTPSAGQGTATVSGTSVVLAFNGAVTKLWAWRQPAQFDLFIYEPSTAVPHAVAAGRFLVIPPITQ